MTPLPLELRAGYRQIRELLGQDPPECILRCCGYEANTIRGSTREMQIKTILSRVQKHPTFVYADARFVEGSLDGLAMGIRPRVGT